MTFQSHVHDDVAVMLVVVRGVKHEHRATRGVAHAIWPRRLHKLIEIGVRRRIESRVAVSERFA